MLATNQLAKNIALVLLGAVLATIVLESSELAPITEDVVEAPLGVDEDNRRVSDDELETYIDVYRTMQTDHSLNIDQVVGNYNLTVKEFRSLERRIQNDSTYVERVREALLEHVQNNSRFSEPTASGAPAKDRPEAEEEPQP